MARVTSVDVAREAGVSQTTVSFVLNGRRDRGISEPTREAVLEAAQRLGYVPSAAARSLRSGRSNVVLCALPPLQASQAVEAFKKHLTAALHDGGYACVFAHVGGDNEPLASLWPHVQPAAVIAMETLAESDMTPLVQAGIPVIDGVLEPTRPEVAGLDQTEVGYLQVQHLVERGHRRIGFAFIHDPLESVFCQPRLEGAQRACSENGLEAPVVAMVDYTRESALEALHTWADRPLPVTAVAAFNDVVAISVLAACRTLGREVPGDLAVVGVDDLPVSALVEPALTTVAIDLRAPARTLAANLLQVLPTSSKKKRSRSTGSPLAVVQREST
jgi:DNA-binding LacI/PurR family transcriptional regulator